MSAVWDFILSNGMTAAESLAQALNDARELHQTHGLQLGNPLTVTPTQRTVVGTTIDQEVTEVDGVVTVARQ